MPRALLLLLLLNACTQPLPEMTATVAEGCGNGRVEGEEECDDGNINDRDACTNGCKHAICGDQILRADLGAGAEGYERCDDGDFDEIFCTRYCQPPRCGDGILLEGPEECDDGNDSEVDSCLNNCRVARCGDGHQQQSFGAFEACDDGNVIQTDACLNNCQPARCGDGETQAGVEECDDGNDIDTDSCLTNCLTATCGDGFVWEGHENCDDGNQSNTDECTIVCIHARCGDFFVRSDLEADEPGYEECDDGNSAPEDDCSPDCLVDDHGNFTATATPLLRSDPLHSLSNQGEITGGDVDFFGHQAESPGRHEVDFRVLGDGPIFCAVYGPAGEQITRVTGDVTPQANGVRFCSIAIFLERGESVWWSIESSGNAGFSYLASLQEPCGNGQLDPEEECDPLSISFGVPTCRMDCRIRNALVMADGFVCRHHNNSLDCWGSNNSRVLGSELPADNQTMCSDELVSRRPIRLMEDLPLGTRVTAHDERICVRKPNHSTLCWGRLVSDENVETWEFCGDATEEQRAEEYPAGRECTSVPTSITLPEEAGEEIDQIALGGSDHLGYQTRRECVIHDYAVFCRGDSLVGTLGFGADYPDASETEWRQVEGIFSWADYLGLGAEHGCIVERFIPTSIVSCWGFNSFGQVGVPSRPDAPTCRTFPCVPTSTNLGYLDDEDPGFGLAPSTSETVSLSVGLFHNCSVNLNGQVLCWGLNDYGQTGQDPEGETCNNRAIVVTPCTASPTAVDGLPPMIDVAVGYKHSCGLSKTGQVWCWGSGGAGQLGTGFLRDQDGEFFQTSTPVRLPALPPIKHIAAGRFTNCAISVDDDLYCWGANLHGEIFPDECRLAFLPIPYARP